MVSCSAGHYSLFSVNRAERIKYLKIVWGVFLTVKKRLQSVKKEGHIQSSNWF